MLPDHLRTQRQRTAFKSLNKLVQDLPAIQHGNRQDPGKKVKLEFRVEQTLVVIEVEDEGEGFDADAVPDPTRDENVDIPSGRGIMLMRAYMTDVDFEPPGNRVRMVYKKA